MRVWLIVAAMMMSACTQLPVLQPMEAPQRTQAAQNCRSHFLQGGWQLVHTINARLQGGHQAILTGVIVLHPDDASIECAVMTLDGFVLFEAVDRQGVTVRRSFGPFANAHFAHGVMNDIRFLFVAPENMEAAGRFEDGASGCRFRMINDRTVDLIEQADGGWQMRKYDRFGSLLRTVTADAPDDDGVSHRLVLSAHGRRSYHLTMTLVEAVPISN